MNIESYKKTLVTKIMTKQYIEVQKDMSVNAFLDRFHKLKNKQRIIAVYDKDKFIGIIEPLNLIKLLVNIKNIADEHILNIHGVDFSFFPKTVNDLVTRHQLTLTGKETIQRAATIMLKRNLTRLAVVQNGKLIGIVKASSLFDNLKEI
jgi:predicted transcriptional regulator